MEENAARRAACQLRASKAGRSWKGGARERADGVFFCHRQKKTPEQSGRPPGLEGTGETRDLQMEENAARRAACQLRASKAGRSWKGGARERADGVFFCHRQKKTPEQSGRPPGLEGTGETRDLQMEENAARRAACQLRASKAGRSWKGGARERADGVFFAAGRKRRRSKADGPPGLEGTGAPRDLRLEKNAARRVACQLRASKAGRSWKGGARERADGVFFAAGRKKTPEQSGLCSDVVPKVGLEPTRYRYQRILSPSRLPFHHFGISTKVSIP